MVTRTNSYSPLVRLGAPALLLSFGGCSTLIGPATPLTNPSPTEIQSHANDGWAHFNDITDAQQKLRGAASFYRAQARHFTLVANTGDDLSVTALLTSTIAGATGYDKAARVAAGTAAIFGFGVNRYKLDIQSHNFRQAALAYECLALATAGLKDSDLARSLPMTNADKDTVSKIRASRILLVSDIERDAQSIGATLDELQANVVLGQPDVAAIEGAVKRQQAASSPDVVGGPRAVSMKSTSDLLGGAGKAGDNADVNALAAELSVERMEVEALRERLALRISTLPTDQSTWSDKDKQDVTAERAAIATAQGKLDEVIANLQAAALALAGSDITDRQQFVIDRLTTMDEERTKCRALLPGRS